MFSEGILFVEIKAEMRASSPRISQKTTCKDKDVVLIEIFNEKFDHDGNFSYESCIFHY